MEDGEKASSDTWHRSRAIVCEHPVGRDSLAWPGQAGPPPSRPIRAFSLASTGTTTLTLSGNMDCTEYPGVHRKHRIRPAMVGFATPARNEVTLGTCANARPKPTRSTWIPARPDQHPHANMMQPCHPGRRGYSTMSRACSTLLFCHSIPITPQRSPATLYDASHHCNPLSDCPMGGGGRGTFETKLTTSQPAQQPLETTAALILHPWSWTMGQILW
jgi:hypothetical protein